MRRLSNTVIKRRITVKNSPGKAYHSGRELLSMQMPETIEKSES